jgi:hypothetical protein
MNSYQVVLSPHSDELHGYDLIATVTAETSQRAVELAFASKDYPREFFDDNGMGEWWYLGRRILCQVITAETVTR